MILIFLKQGNANIDALSAYNFSFKDVSGAEFSLNDYKDKVLVVVNVASRCGFTNQYKDLQMISDKYKESNVIVNGKIRAPPVVGPRPGNTPNIKPNNVPKIKTINNK